MNRNFPHNVIADAQAAAAEVKSTGPTKILAFDPSLSRAVLLCLASAYTTYSRIDLAKRLGMKQTWTWQRMKEFEKAIQDKAIVSVPRWGPIRADTIWEKLRYDVERKINERTVAA